jgi:flavin-binding protein dodecin
MSSVARVTEISATPPLNFEDAIRTGVARANEILRNVRSAWVKEQQVAVQDGTWQSFASTSSARSSSTDPHSCPPRLFGARGPRDEAAHDDRPKRSDASSENPESPSAADWGPARECHTGSRVIVSHPAAACVARARTRHCCRCCRARRMMPRQEDRHEQDARFRSR